MTLCSFCQCAPAAVFVPQRPSRGKETTTTGGTSRPPNHHPTPLCLPHYYTTSACRVGGWEVRSHTPPTTTTVLHDRTALQSQQSAAQELFAEAFVQLRQELQDAMVRQHRKHRQDPLAVLVDLHRPRPRRLSSAAAREEGGFLRPVPVPERLRRTQRQQWKQQQSWTDRMNRAAAKSTAAIQAATRTRKEDPTQRRQASKRSVWSVLDATTRPSSSASIQEAQPGAIDSGSAPSTCMLQPDEPDFDNDQTCTCGSTRVETVSSNSGQLNQDVAKAETWGTKDRAGEIVTRYRCTACGKTWYEQE